MFVFTVPLVDVGAAFGFDCFFLLSPFCPAIFSSRTDGCCCFVGGVLTPFTAVPVSLAVATFLPGAALLGGVD